MEGAVTEELSQLSHVTPYDIAVMDLSLLEAMLLDFFRSHDDARYEEPARIAQHIRVPIDRYVQIRASLDTKVAQYSHTEQRIVSRAC